MYWKLSKPTLIHPTNIHPFGRILLGLVSSILKNLPTKHPSMQTDRMSTKPKYHFSDYQGLPSHANATSQNRFVICSNRSLTSRYHTNGYHVSIKPKYHFSNHQGLSSHANATSQKWLIHIGSIPNGK